MNSDLDGPRASAEEADVVVGYAEVASGLLTGRSFGRRHVEFSVVDNRAIFEGDIDLGSPDELAAALDDAVTKTSDEMNAAVVDDTAKLWVGGRVPFEAPAAASPITPIVNAAIQHINQRTNAQFVPIGDGDTDHVVFEASASCSSQVGRVGGAQVVHLSPDAVTGNAIHELSHVLGLWHEQSRHDRDQYVQIVWQNIMAGYEHNFRQQVNDEDDVGPYDYGSIMHYPRDAFSTNGQATIVPLAADAVIGQRDHLSDGDIAAINSLYPARPPLSPAAGPGGGNALATGTQFSVSLAPLGVERVETHGWEPSLHVHWDVTPTSGASDTAPMLRWQVDVGRGAGGDLRYYFTIENLTGDPIAADARYLVLGSEPQ
jgi:hypothetical protein